MRPIEQIRADWDALPPAPPLELGSWEAYCERLTPEELEELREHDDLEVITRSRNCAITIPPAIANDPRLCARERFVVAAIEDVRRELDVALPARVIERLYGPVYDTLDAKNITTTIASLVYRGIVVHTRDGGVFRRAA